MIINRKVVEAVKDLIFPPRCPVCDNVLKISDKLICMGCYEKLKYVQSPSCMKCGKPLKAEEHEYCHDCSEKNHIFERGVALFEYSSVHESIYRFKYQGRKEYGAFYASQISLHLGKQIEEMKADALIPVPLHKKKMRIRGYNQAQVLAEEMSKYIGIPTRTDMVERKKWTVPQKELNNSERQKNLKKAFNIVENDVKLDTIIIVDDIYTTGSTINELAREFKKTGVEKVYFIALAIGSGF